MTSGGGWLARVRRQALTVFVAVAAVMLVGFALWCSQLISEVNERREDLSTRVGWLGRLQELQTRGQEDPGNAVANAAIAEAVRVLAREVVAEPRTAEKLRSVAATAQSQHGEPLPHISRLVLAIRGEMSEVSEDLSDSWNEINWLVGISLALAASTLGLMIYVRFVLLRRAERAYTGLAAHLRDADRLVAVGTLAAGVAHELSNPLSYIVSNLEHLESNRRSERERQELIAEALGGLQRVIGIVRDLRAVARPTRDDISACDVESCIEAALAITGNERRKVVRVHRRYGEIEKVWGSDARLGQLFLNLIINAVHAMEGQEDSELRFSTSLHSSDMVAVEIRDNGPGVPPELLDHIFEPFVTSKPLGKGTGLGLFVCHNIVQSLDGEISLDTGPDGTTVKILLPSVRLGEPAPTRSSSRRTP